MILQIVKTFVDEDNADVETWEIEVTDAELVVLQDAAKGLPDPNDGEEPLVFRGVEYTNENHDIDDLLRVVGKPVVIDETIAVYVY